MMPEKYPWNLPGWEKRKEATWPLEWLHGMIQYRLTEIRTSEGVIFIRESKRGENWHAWERDKLHTDHEAACLIRENNRVWLAEQGTHIDFAKLSLTVDIDTAQAAVIDGILAEKAGDDSGE